MAKRCVKAPRRMIATLISFYLPRLPSAIRGQWLPTRSDPAVFPSRSLIFTKFAFETVQKSSILLFSDYFTVADTAIGEYNVACNKVSSRTRIDFLLYILSFTILFPVVGSSLLIPVIVVDVIIFSIVSVHVIDTVVIIDVIVTLTLICNVFGVIVLVIDLIAVVVILIDVVVDIDAIFVISWLLCQLFLVKVVVSEGFIHCLYCTGGWRCRRLLRRQYDRIWRCTLCDRHSGHLCTCCECGCYSCFVVVVVGSTS